MTHDWMRDGWEGGKPFTVCGHGSLPEYTANIRRALPEWSHEYGIRSVADAGAGDMCWKVGMEWAVEYRPYDLFPKRTGVEQWDITVRTLPFADLILCRMVLNHLQPQDVEQALTLFAFAGEYLAATTFPGGGPQRSPTFRRYDLARMLGEPLESVQDGSEDGCRLALWKL